MESDSDFSIASEASSLEHETVHINTAKHSRIDHVLK